MIIRNIKLVRDNRQITLSADLQFQGEKAETMFFSTDVRNEKYVFSDASPFLASVLIPCMRTKEDIFIDGCISAEFFSNTKEIMNLLSSWDKKFRKINIFASEIKKDKAISKNTASFFSAGVDSFYTFFKHEKEIDDLVFVYGSDITLNNRAFFSNVKKAAEKITRETNKNLIIVTTNIKGIIEKKVLWDFAHGGALAAVGLFLRKKIKTLYIAGAVSKNELFPYGTHPELDKLWSAESINFVHDGIEYNRFEKIINTVSRSPLALKYLRVCPQNVKGKYNCSRCYKCLITMIYLECAGVLGKSETFDKRLDLSLVRNMYYNYNLHYNKQGEVSLNFLKKKNLKTELQKAIKYSLEKSKHPGVLRRILNKIAYFDQNYNKRRLFRYVFRIKDNGDRSLVFKFLFRHKLLK